MRHSMLLFLGIGLLALCVDAPSSAVYAATPESRTSTARGGQPKIGACSVLTRALVEPFAENKRVLDLIPPQEETLPSGGTACEYGPVRLQLHLGRSGKPTVSAKGLQPVSGAGDGGYFRSNRNRYAELMVWSRKHSLDLQVSVPTGGSAEAMQPQVIALANAILAKLP